MGYVNIIGQAEELPPAEALEHWDPMMNMFYPEGSGKGEGRFSVFRLKPQRLELVSDRLGVDSSASAAWTPPALTLAPEPVEGATDATSDGCLWVAE
jgi:hypothetical protein